MNLALFDLDHTILPLDSDFEWGQFLVRIGAVDAENFAQRNAAFYAQYEAGTLDPVEYLGFAIGTIASFPRAQREEMREQFLNEVIRPAIRPAALELVRKHQDAGDLIAIITATNRFITEPIAPLFDIDNLIAADIEHDANGEMTGKLLGTPTSGAGKIVHCRAWLEQSGRTLEQFERSYFYSDSQNDIPLLSLVTHPVATNPNALLRAHATAHNWPIVNLFDD